MLQLLTENPLLLLFVTCGIGFALGRLKVKGVSLGVSAVLFVGLAIGSQHPDLAIPPFIRTLGLSIFVYTMGLSSGAHFFASFKQKGLIDNIFVVAIIVLTAAIVLLIAQYFEFKPSIAAGFFTGVMTNTPALASIQDTIRAQHNSSFEMMNEPVIAYSIAYPMAVLGPILAIALMRALFKIDYQKEARRLKALNLTLTQERIDGVTIKVTKNKAIDQSVREIHRHFHTKVVFTRVIRNDNEVLADGDLRLQKDDLVYVVGEPDDVTRLVRQMGEICEDAPAIDRSHYDYRRIFVSNPKVVGRPISDLHLMEHHGAIITRIRRGDVDMVAHPSSILELGDRVRVVADIHKIEQISKLFGDSYKRLSEIDLLSFGLGMAMGVALGLVKFPLPGGYTFELGFAGGPLIVGLILGAKRRTGSIIWNIPYSANLTLRQLGLVMFLACVGISSGYTFREQFFASGGLTLLLYGAAISLLVPFTMLVVGYCLFKVPYGKLSGMLAGLYTQPAVLGYATDASKDEAPNIGYAIVYPMSMIVKIILVQLLFTFLGGIA